MGFLDNVKKTAVKTKLAGEIVLLDREMATRKQRFGVDLYNVLSDWERSHESEGDFPLEGLKDIHQAAKEDVFEIAKKRNDNESQIDEMESKASANATAQSASEKAKSAKQWITKTGAAAKLKTEIAFLDREIRLRKEIFGVQAFDELKLGEHPVNQEVAAAISGIEHSSVHIDNEDVLAVIERAKMDVKKIMDKKHAKQDEIEGLSAS